MSIIFIITLWFLVNAGTIPAALAIWGTVIGSLHFLMNLFLFGVRLGFASRD